MRARLLLPTLLAGLLVMACGGTEDPDHDPTGDTCSEDTYVADGSCVACPAGTTNAAGDPVTGANTSCEPILCGEDTHVVSNACAACAPGTTNPAGDDASGEDTQCEALLCEENEHVQSHACVPCAEGLLNPAGDDASGPDTACVEPDACMRALGVSCPEFTEGQLRASNRRTWDMFGHAVAISGDTLVVGTPREASGATGVDGDQTGDGASYSGAAYVFVRDGETWSQQAYLKASNAERGDEFGYSVAIDGDLIAVGARLEDGDDNGHVQLDSGAVYVFRRTGDTWAEEAYVKQNDPGYDYFGSSVALQGDTLFVGAPRRSDVHHTAGAVFVFTRSGSQWTSRAALRASNARERAWFGYSVAVSGDTVVVGAPYMNSGASSSGAAYVFVGSGASWTEQAVLTAPTPIRAENVGFSVAIDGDTLVVGTYDESAAYAEAPELAAGAAYVFTRSGTQWAREATLKASNPDTDDAFGWSVTLQGNVIVVGAIAEASSAAGLNGDQNNNEQLRSGAAYVFKRSQGGWTQQAYLKSSTPTAEALFGHAVALDGDSLVVGAAKGYGDNIGGPGDPDVDSGWVEVFRIAP